MKDEIKSFLVQIKGNDEWKEIYNYITNLQEENKHLDKVNCQLRKKINNDVYKSRNEKAIEYINKNCVLSDEWKDLGFCNFIPTGRIEYKQLSKTKIKYLLNILQGSDKDE